MADFLFDSMPKGENMIAEMLNAITEEPKRIVPTEGELYKVVTTYGKTFELRYGYYEDFERENQAVEPMPIYPNFKKQPLYTDDGSPFVTMMQEICPHYKGEKKRTPDSACDECKYFKQGEDWFGICTCAKNKKLE